MSRWMLLLGLCACKEGSDDSDTDDVPGEHFLTDDDWFWGELTGNVGSANCSDHGILQEMATTPTGSGLFRLSLVEEGVQLNCSLGANNSHTCGRFTDDQGSFDEISVTTSDDEQTLTLSFTEYAFGVETPCATPVIVGERLN